MSDLTLEEVAERAKAAQARLAGYGVEGINVSERSEIHEGVVRPGLSISCSLVTILFALEALCAVMDHKAGEEASAASFPTAGSVEA